MAHVLFIFAAGLGGVFLGMAFLYASIRVTTYIVGRWVNTEDST